MHQLHIGRQSSVKKNQGSDVSIKTWSLTVPLMALASTISILSGCGAQTTGQGSGTQVHWVTSNGARFTSNTEYAFDELNTSDIETDVASRLSSTKNWDLSKLTGWIKNVRVKVVDKPFYDSASFYDGGYGVQLVAGVEYGWDVIVANYPYNCPWQSAYGHELAHIFLQINTGSADDWHQDAAAWGQVRQSAGSHNCNKEEE